MEFEMDEWMMAKAVRRFEVANIVHVICNTQQFDAPFAEFFFQRDKWHFLRVLYQLPIKETDGSEYTREGDQDA